MPTSIHRTRSYRARPPAANRAARVVWDELSRRAARMTPARYIETLWFSPEQENWSAYLNEIDINERSPYLDMDSDEVRSRLANPRNYAANDE